MNNSTVAIVAISILVMCGSSIVAVKAFRAGDYRRGLLFSNGIWIGLALYGATLLP